MVTKTVQRTLIIRPSTLHLDPKIEHHLRLEDFFHIEPCGAADELQAVTILADDDLLLAFLVDQNQSMNVQNVALQRVLLDLHCHLIRQFIAKLTCDLFSNDLSRQETGTLVRDLILGEQERTDRKSV